MSRRGPWILAALLSLLSGGLAEAGSRCAILSRLGDALADATCFESPDYPDKFKHSFCRTGAGPKRLCVSAPFCFAVNADRLVGPAVGHS